MLYAADPYSGRVFAYGDHWTNLIVTKDPKSRKKITWVLDPQFQVKPIKLTEYLATLVQPGIKLEPEGKSRNPEGLSCFYRSVDRRSYQKLAAEIRISNERKTEKAGAIDAFGGTMPLPRRGQKSLQRSLESLPDWFDSRIKWDTDDLNNLTQDMMRINLTFKAVSDRSAVFPSTALEGKRRAAILESLAGFETENKYYLEYDPKNVTRQKMFHQTQEYIRLQREWLR